MRKQLLTVFALFLAAMSVWAQGPSWRYNRYNGFKAHKITDKTIVFFGNSITCTNGGKPSTIPTSSTVV